MLRQTFPLLNQNAELKLQNLVIHGCEMNGVQKLPISNHTNYQLFERIPAVPVVSSNGGLTAQVI